MVFGKICLNKLLCIKTEAGVIRNAKKTYVAISTSPTYVSKEMNDEKLGTVNKYTNRTHTCGELTKKHIGKNVVLYGWLEYQRMNKFVVLRDTYGETQLLLSDKLNSDQSPINQMPYETIIEVKGTVSPRPLDMVNPRQKTGEVEVHVENITAINKAKVALPFNIREFQKAKEALRMQYRYLDLRFPQMQRNLRVRSRLLMRMREFLIEHHFVDVETPTLFKATPGGAQEFIVPTRIPGKFYSLVQSPQQFKQMLMAGGLDRYFQIAKCYRDEGSRPDRQPEFTQLDIELSFTNMEAVLKLIEELLCYTLEGFYDGVPKQFPRIFYEEAMESYGSDKPDVTFDFKLQNCTDLLRDNGHFNITNSDDFGAYILVFKKSEIDMFLLNNTIKEHNKKIASQYPHVKLIQSKIRNKEDWISKMNKLFLPQESEFLLQKYMLEEETVVFLAGGKKSDARKLLGKIRLDYVQYLEQNLSIKDLRKPGLHFLWVVNFPLFEFDRVTQTLQSAHHPFTAPRPEDQHLLTDNPLEVRALAYDLVLNGNEVGGGSIRIHNPDLQKTVLDLLNIKVDSLQHIIDMLGSGCPPHGGIALGLDRLLSILLDTASIRDVMAFPKTFEGKDPISQAPSEVTTDTLKMYHIQTVPPSE